VALRLLSAETRNALLSQLLHEPLTIFLDDKNAELPSFNNAQVALQTNIDRAPLKKLSKKYLLAITSFDIDSVGDSEIVYDSNPDAWIFDSSEGFVFLIEAKIGENPLNDDQIRSHADSWLGIKNNLEQHLLSMTWYDLLQAIDTIKQMTVGDAFSLNQQETLLLNDMIAYLGFFGYHLFEGFDFSTLQKEPHFEFSVKTYGISSFPGESFDFSELEPHPIFYLERS
jgi:hypothetical protein